MNILDKIEDDIVRGELGLEADDEREPVEDPEKQIAAEEERKKKLAEERKGSLALVDLTAEQAKNLIFNGDCPVKKNLDKKEWVKFRISGEGLNGFHLDELARGINDNKKSLLLKLKMKEPEFKKFKKWLDKCKKDKDLTDKVK